VAVVETSTAGTGLGDSAGCFAFVTIILPRLGRVSAVVAVTAKAPPLAVSRVSRPISHAAIVAPQSNPAKKIAHHGAFRRERRFAAEAIKRSALR
jgi:hypothetical protein